MSVCSSCGEDLLGDNDVVKCSVSNCKLHYTCAGVAEKSWKQMGNVRRETYCCILCRNLKKDSGSVSEFSSVFDAKEGLSKLPENFFENLEKKVENIVQRAVEKKLKMFNDTILDFQKSVDYCSSSVDDFVEKIKIMDKKCEEVVKNHLKLVEANQKLENEVTGLKTQLEELLQYGRNVNVQIEGVPEVRTENVIDLVCKLATAINEPVVPARDIQAAHRLPSKNKNKPRPIVVQFSNRFKRDSFLKKAKKEKAKSTVLVPSAPERKLFVNDHLTPYYKKLFFDAKTLKQQKGFKFLWVMNSKIFLKKDESCNAEKVSSERDLEKLNKEYPDVVTTDEEKLNMENSEVKNADEEN